MRYGADQISGCLACTQAAGVILNVKPMRKAKLVQIKHWREFNLWFVKNHPLDWWKSQRNGKPLSHRDRLLVKFFAEQAFEAGSNLNCKER